MQVSAGLVLYRVRGGQLELLLAHLGGPFFARKDDGAWTVPKGLAHADEALLDAAEREFEEETGAVPESCCASGDPSFMPLGEVRQKGGKVVHAWAFEGDCDPDTLESNTFEIEWPPRSGRKRSFPEVDRFAFFPAEVARNKLLRAQVPFVDRLCGLVSRDEPGDRS